MKNASALAATVIVLVGLPASLRAEEGPKPRNLYVDIYAGAAFTQDENVTVTNTLGRLTPPNPTRDTLSSAFQNSGEGGIRAGWWIPPVPWLGWAADFSWFAPNTSLYGRSAQINVFPISLLVMGRIPILRSDEIPGGRIQPYVGAGPGAFISQLSYNTGYGAFTNTQVDIGADARGGVKFMVTDRVGMFVEYRFTYFDPTWEDNPGGGTTFVDTKLLTHHANAGVSIHF